MAGGFTMEQDVEVPMRDGTILRADVYRPLGAGPFPALPTRTPYDKSGGMDGRRAGRAPSDGRGLRDGAHGRAWPVPVGWRVRALRARGGRRLRHRGVGRGAALVRWQRGHDRRLVRGLHAVVHRHAPAAASARDRAGRRHQRPPRLLDLRGRVLSLWFNMSWMFAALGADITTRRFPGDGTAWPAPSPRPTSWATICRAPPGPSTPS